MRISKHSISGLLKHLNSSNSITAAFVGITFAVQTLVAQRLDQDWEYTRGDLGGVWEALREENLSPLPQWIPVSLPHCFNATDSVNPYQPYYQGPGWYRRKLEINCPFPDGRIELHFEGAGQKTKVFINQKPVGTHVGGYDAFTIDVTDAVLQELGSLKGVISLVVRCDNSRDLEMIPSDLSDFNLYGGLYRPVFLRYRPAVSADWPVIDASVDNRDSTGTVHIQTRISNPENKTGKLQLIWSIRDTDGNTIVKEPQTLEMEPGKMMSVRFENKIPKPRLWSTDTPNLYTWELESTWGDADERFKWQGKMGFRSFEFISKGPFKLNGERLLLRGTHRHEDHAGVAAAQSDASIEKELKLMKSMGVNFIRLGHYQQYRKVLELCDELGILVWEEIPWCRGGLGGETYQQQAKRMLENMIAQHRHHPSIILWGLGNENDWPGDFPEFDKSAIRHFMNSLNELAHSIDPSRKTCIRRCDFCADIVDVYSPSIWAGWYRGKYTDYREVSEREMQKVNHFLHVEWGASHHTGRHSENPDQGLTNIKSGDADERDGDFLMNGGDARVSRDGDWTETYACNLIDWHLKEQELMPWLTGTAYWPFKDFSTPIRPENPIPYMNQKGVVERDLTPKESFFVFQSYWTDSNTNPMVHIYGHTWPVRWGNQGETKMVKVYSNCGEVELFLNGKSQGVRHRNSQNFPAAGLRWNISFEEGSNELKAIATTPIGTIEDTMVQEYQTEPWEKPSQLQLSVISTDVDFATIEVYAVDANGIRCLDAMEFVEFDLTGDGKLIADMGTASASRKVQLSNGRAQIRIKKNHGTSILSVKSVALPTAFIRIE